MKELFTSFEHQYVKVFEAADNELEIRIAKSEWSIQNGKRMFEKWSNSVYT